MPIPGGPRPDHVEPRPFAGVLAHLGVPARVRQAAAGADRLAQGRAAGPGPQITGVTLSSRAVRPGDLYAALPGSRTHGAAFAAEAAAAGAVAVLTDPSGAERAAATGLPVAVVDDPRARLGELASWIYGEPGGKLLTLGVTGTNGKTTTTTILDAALRSAGRCTGLVGTVEWRLADERIPSTGTTPESPDLHALLAVMVERGVTTCALEVSSHALVLHRTDGLVLDVAAFTNLSQDHLDFHGTMEAYFAAKASLFTPEHARRGVICVDDAWGAGLATSAGVPVATVAAQPGGQADWRVVAEGLDAGLPVAQVEGPGGLLVRLRSPLPGRFNLANALVALAVLVEAGVFDAADAQAAADALALAGPVPGRMERVGEPGQWGGAPLAVVDFAHSPDAVEQALAALAGSAAPGRPLVVVLGAGGDRDREKRPLMGEAAARGADVVVVTDDNPRSEDPVAIRAAVRAGAERASARTGAVVVEAAGRRAAIAEGVRRAWPGGVVLVAGKGHEQGQEVAGVIHPFDDRSALRAALLEVADEVAAETAAEAAAEAAGQQEGVR
ncbi:MAG TPA: UDP-N-acetylmuramoyl-L-alanyl-D-glutamate--2,6-diaminopimelate ligase [Kineosporiaceae bacterium]|nr:UDP-N-acetylmuramoyl-L-alanyl-D-glutamate--2,6-diaminopimelate ligase [Kineosporiaceae bacterium]